MNQENIMTTFKKTYSQIVQTALVAVLLLSAAPSAAKEPKNLQDIQRESRIVADVMKSALRGELGQGMRLTNADAQYLARQGVLITLSVNSPWLTIHEDGQGTSLEFNGEFSLPAEIPALVENILEDLQIDAAPFDADALDELRELRHEQRAMRGEQRSLRSRLRAARRALVRAEGDDSKSALREEIQGIEEDLKHTEVEYDELSNAIDEQYQRLRTYRDDAKPPPAPPSPPDVDLVIAGAVCDYGATLKSLSSDRFITIALRRGKTTQYFAFLMNHVKECSRSNLKPERLLELAYQYDG